VAQPEDLLSEQERASNLDEAERLYRAVLEKNSKDNAKALTAISAAYGLAAVAESRGKLDEAKGYYEQVKKIADLAGFPEHSKVAQERIDGLPKLAEKPKLFTKAELPKPPEPPAPTGPTGSIGSNSAQGEHTLTVGPALGSSGATGPTGGTGETGATGASGASGAQPTTGEAPPGSTEAAGATGGSAATGSTGGTGQAPAPAMPPQQPAPK
jgi:hypothetical protein